MADHDASKVLFVVGDMPSFNYFKSDCYFTLLSIFFFLFYVSTYFFLLFDSMSSIIKSFHCSIIMQIVNWRTHLKFPEEAKLSPEAKDLISKLLCNVDQRLGTKGADEIKVLCGVFCSKILWFTVKMEFTLTI